MVRKKNTDDVIKAKQYKEAELILLFKLNRIAT